VWVVVSGGICAFSNSEAEAPIAIATSKSSLSAQGTMSYFPSNLKFGVNGYEHFEAFVCVSSCEISFVCVCRF